MSEKLIVPDEVVISKIYHLRKQKVMLDSDLATLYGVETRVLNQQVKRNEYRFPKDFMFQLTQEEFENLKSQNASSSWGGRRKLPNAFTEHGVLMLSSVLSSRKAVAVNIQIMRIFTKMREMLLTNKDLLIKMNTIESKVSNQDKSIKQIFGYLKQLIKEQEEPEPARKSIGFKTKHKK